MERVTPGEQKTMEGEILEAVQGRRGERTLRSDGPEDPQSADPPVAPY